MTLATITFQNFPHVRQAIGMTGTAKTEEEEFQRIYNLDVVMAPTYKPIVRDDMPDMVYRTPEVKFKAVIEDIAAAHQRGQPVLVGTVAIETSELVSRMLKRAGVPHEVLNAKNHEREATIIAQAGRPGSVTIATNMAGRGVDILLGGNPEGLAREELRHQGIDLTEIPQHDWIACVDMLKRGQEPTSAYPEPWTTIPRSGKKPRDREMVKSLAGCTSRHRTPRSPAHRQPVARRSGCLRTRPPSYLSMGDLMRRFGASASATMDGWASRTTRLLCHWSQNTENAQTKVEGHNFDIRKHVLQYDEVVNEQRNRIYDQRRRILREPSMKVSIETMIEEEVRSLVASFTTGNFEEEWRLDELAPALNGIFHLPSDFSVDQWRGMKQSEIADHAVQMALDVYHAKEAELGEDVMRRAEKQIMLWAVDSRWVRHLTDLDRLREGIGLQALAQVDPLVAYKREAFNMYGELMSDITGDIVKAIYTVQVQKPVPMAATPIARNIRTNRADGGAPAQQTVRKTGPQLGRNDPCWCGSGKKIRTPHAERPRPQVSRKPQLCRTPAAQRWHSPSRRPLATVNAPGTAGNDNRETKSDPSIARAHMSIAGGVSQALTVRRR